VSLVIDQGAVKQFVTASLDPAFDDRVHPGHLNTTQNDLDTGIDKDDVEQLREFAASVADQESRSAVGVVEGHGEVAVGLSYPGRGRMGCDAEDADAAGGVFDDSQDEQRGPSECSGFEEVRGEDGVCLVAERLCPCPPLVR
jgi:hypothetical protein